MSRLVAAGSTLAIVGCAHAWLNARLLRRPVPGTAAPARVSVLVPARDEAAHIGSCVRDLLRQHDAEIAEILLLDDESSDGTGTIARAAAGGDPRVRVLTGEPPPPGWLGKPWACAQLAAAADPASGVLVFVDADVRLAPGAVAAAAALLDSAGLDLVAPHPKQVAITGTERLVQPLLQWSFLTTLPLRVAERSARPSMAAANGQFLAARRISYERAGGHSAVRAAVLDDLALARAIRASGGRTAMAEGSRLASCRMYSGWAEVRDGYGKSLWAAFGSEPGALGILAALGVIYVLPATAALRGSRWGLAGYLAGVGSRVVAARSTGGRVWPDALAHPVSVAVFGYLTVRSFVQHRRGALSWKGRPV